MNCARTRDLMMWIMVHMIGNKEGLRGKVNYKEVPHLKMKRMLLNREE